MRKLALIVAALDITSLAAHADLPVIDPSVLVQSIQEVQLTIEQLHQVTTEVKRMGNPASIIPVGATAVIQSLGQIGVVKGWNDIRGSATAIAAMDYDGDGLYHIIGESITNLDGQKVSRDPNIYRKFDAVVRAASALKGVMADTDTRRQRIRDEIKATTEKLQTASTIAEIQKLQGTLSAQSAELGAIDREREAAMNWVIAQRISDENDAEKQKAALQEDRIVDFKSAQDKLIQFLTPNTDPVQIPDPRASKP